MAAPALHLDAAFVHMNRADRHGNAQFLGPDPFFDDVFLGAADARYVTAEKVVEPGATARVWTGEHRSSSTACSPMPSSRHLAARTSRAVSPDYARDEEFQRAYVKAAGGAEAWADFSARYLDVGEREYQSLARRAT